MGKVVFSKKVIDRLEDELRRLFLDNPVKVILINQGTGMGNIMTLEWADVAAESHKPASLRIVGGGIYCNPMVFQIVNCHSPAAGFSFYQNNTGEFLWHTPKKLLLLGETGALVTVNFPMPVAYLSSILTVEV